MIAAAFNYTGLSAQEMEERITSIYERSLTTTVNDIEHIESQSIDGRAIIKVFFPARRRHQRRRSPGERDFRSRFCANCRPARRRRFCSPTTPPACPSSNSASAGSGLSEQALFDYGVNFIRTRLVTIPGCAIPYPYGGKQRQIMVDINPAAMQSKGLSPADVTTAIANQNLIIPGGHLEDRPVRIRRGSELQPHHGGGVQRLSRSRW